MKSTGTSVTKSVCVNRRFSEYRTTSWRRALGKINALGGFAAFKSTLFQEAFKAEHRYDCEFLILGRGGKLQGAMTYWFEERNTTYDVGPIWHIGDFDTAKRTEGVAHELLSRFMDRCGDCFYLWCWDADSERFWRHMGRRHKLAVHKIGVSPWGSAVLMFSPRPARGKHTRKNVF